MIVARLIAGLLVLVAVAPARADELERLREENARLRGRIEALEAENAKLRRDGSGSLAAALETSAKEAVQVEARADGATTVETEPSRLETSSGPHSRHWLTLRAVVTGGRAPDAVDLVVDAAASGGAYRGVDRLALVVDGRHDELPILRRASESRAPVRGTGGAGAASESITAALPRAALARLADAREAEGVLGPTRFRFTPPQLAAIRAFRTRLDETR